MDLELKNQYPLSSASRVLEHALPEFFEF